jgi:predicted secreted protein
VLGYSEDGTIFAFEEYGSYDGSGFAYSNIYFIDTQADRFLPGTPIKVQIDEEESLGKIRGLARDKAEPLIARYRLAENPGQMLVYNPSSEVDSDPHQVRYYGYASSPQQGQTSTLLLTQKEFPPVSDCLNMTGNYTGFTLSLSEYEGKAVDKVLHADAQIPKSRNCPNGYRIGAVIGSQTGSAPDIAMIMVASFGFEGNDQRWIAVPITPDGP